MVVSKHIFIYIVDIIMIFSDYQLYKGMDYMTTWSMISQTGNQIQVNIIVAQNAVIY